MAAEAKAAKGGRKQAVVKAVTQSIPVTSDEDLDFTLRMNRDISDALKILSREEARNLVRDYYAAQKRRIALESQIAKALEAGKSARVLGWLYQNCAMLEQELKGALKVYADSVPMGIWAQEQLGIGPVIAAGLAAYISIEGRQTVGAIWRYGGVDPTSKWLPGQKRPWNAELKTLIWKIGDSFQKVSNRENAVYGQIYKARKEYEEKKNLDGDYADQAAARAKMVGKDTVAYSYYSRGLLPPAHITARAKRYAAKLFLSHWFFAAYYIEHGVEPPDPYAIGILGHADMMYPPGWPARVQELRQMALLMEAEQQNEAAVSSE